MTCNALSAVALYSPGLRNVVEQLVTVDLATGKLAPMLATAWKQVDDTTWEFTLGDGVTFHDGSPFNAEAAAFAVNWVWNPQNSFHIRETMASQITAEAAGDNVIHVKTETADPLIPWRMYLGGITSMKQILENASSVDENPIGTGPYRFVEWRKGQDWNAEVNPDWWGHKADDDYAKVSFNKLRGDIHAGHGPDHASVSPARSRHRHREPYHGHKGRKPPLRRYEAERQYARGPARDLAGDDRAKNAADERRLSGPGMRCNGR
jgi:hypothetical protein